MTKDRIVPEAIVRAVAAARAVHAEFDVRCPEDIRLAIFAAAKNAFIAWSPSAPQDAHVVATPEGAIILIREDQRGTPRGRFSGAHELGHLHLHTDLDASLLLHGQERTSGSDYRFEREADAFAVELLMPTALLAPICAQPAPRFRKIEKLAWRYGTSLMTTARRWTELATAPCALLEWKDGVVTRVDKTAAFRGDIARGRAVDDCLAALKGATLENAAVPETGATLTWAWHDAGWERPKRKTARKRASTTPAGT
jgi:hypothetical protein